MQIRDVDCFVTEFSHERNVKFQTKTICSQRKVFVNEKDYICGREKDLIPMI